METNRAVNAVIAESGDVLLHSMRADVWANQTGFVSERLATLMQSAWQGLLLVCIRAGCRRHDDIEIVPAGEIAQQENLSQNLWKAFILACLLIYALLAVPLRSYVQPLIILSVLPFGFVGAVLGHYFMNIPFSVLSFFGMLAVSGIVVNDSLLLVTTYNDEVTNGVDDPIVSATLRRFRAVFLTTVTTVAGLMPILLQTSEQARYLIPAAVSVVFGELFVTTITLILIPVLIAIVHAEQATEQTRIGSTYGAVSR